MFEHALRSLSCKAEAPVCWPQVHPELHHVLLKIMRPQPGTADVCPTLPMKHRPILDPVLDLALDVPLKHGAHLAHIEVPSSADERGHTRITPQPLGKVQIIYTPEPKGQSRGR